jgi:predicted DNA-binding protein (MmcQ/YjbR family)
MHFKELDTYLLSKKSATFDYPFDEEVRVYRIANKMFALMVDEENLSINLKCDPIYALELRSLYQSIKAGYHMNKKHWNTVSIGGDVDDELLKELIDHSYDLVYGKLSKREKALLGQVLKSNRKYKKED